MKNIKETDYSTARWVYSKTENNVFRTAEINGYPVIQKRIVFPENSHARLSLKALQGQYSLLDMKVIGAGNSYLIIGWENTNMVVKEAQSLLK